MPKLVKMPAETEDREMRALRQHYAIADSSRAVIHRLEQEPALGALLCEAAAHLQDAFGEGRLLRLRAQQSEDDNLLKVEVQLPADFRGDPERALSSFDEQWWLNNCHRSRGALVFDYEIQDSV